MSVYSVEDISSCHTLRDGSESPASLSTVWLYGRVSLLPSVRLRISYEHQTEIEGPFLSRILSRTENFHKKHHNAANNGQQYYESLLTERKSTPTVLQAAATSKEKKREVIIRLDPVSRCAFAHFQRL
jgi:hypothetical protein